MSMKPQPIREIPAETVRVVRAVFPKGNIYIHLRDTLGRSTRMDNLRTCIPIVANLPMRPGV
jgi:hypothetical protein